MKEETVPTTGEELPQNWNEFIEKFILNENDFWMILAFMLFLLHDIKMQKQWDEFERELIYDNRFFSNHPIVEEIHRREAEAAIMIPRGKFFYRARIYNQKAPDKLLLSMLKAAGKTKEERLEILSDGSVYVKELLIPLFNYLKNDGDQDYTLAMQISDAYDRWVDNVRFKGYNAAESTAPKAELVTSGRANPDHIRYLYLCEDDLTPVYEVRPYIGQTVSVAKFKLTRDVKVYDFTKDIKEEQNNIQFESLFNSIGRMFSRPYTGEMSKYIPTQYLAEEIKRMGFDGIRFKSSLNEGGVNLVLFDPEVCKAVSSDLVNVKSITIGTETPWIYQIGSPNP